MNQQQYNQLHPLTPGETWPENPEVNLRLQRQDEAAEKWASNSFRGTLAAGTGFGKTRTSLVPCVKRLATHLGRYPKVIIVTPKETNRDDDWPAEINKWVHPFNHSDFQAHCWAMAHKLDLSEADMLILDEAHHITELNYPNIEGFKGAIVGLTATPPHELDKAAMLRAVAPVVFTFSLEKGIEEDINAPYIFHAIGIFPDTLLKNIPAGTKDKPFLQSEYAAHQYLDKAILREAQQGKIEGFRAKNLIRKRMTAIYNSTTKRKAAKAILSKVYKPDKRILVFGGSIEQIELLMPQWTYHSGSTKDKNTKHQQYPKPPGNRLADFRAGTLNMLATVGMVDEGANFDNLDIGIMIQADQSERRLKQRIGRLVRQREDYFAHIYGLYLRGTQDEKWMKTCLSTLPQHRVQHFLYDDLNHFVKDDKWMITT